MKIVYVINYFQPKIGYQEYYLAKEHQEMGHEVHVVTSDRYSPFPDYSESVGKILGDRRVSVGLFQEEGIAVHRLPCLFEYAPSSFIIIRGLKGTLWELRPDVVSVDGIFSPIAYIAGRCKKALRYGLVHDTHASTFNTNLTDTLPKCIYRFFFQKLMMPVIRDNADAIIAVGESERWLACREFGLDPEQVPIIYLGADVDLFKFDEARRKQVRESLGVGEDDVLLIHAGKITPHKDVHVLMEAVVPLMRENGPLKLLIVGGGDKAYLGSLGQIMEESGVSNSVIFHHFVRAEELPEFYSASDIGIWPGSISNTIQEGMATSLPIILPEVFGGSVTSKHLLANDNGFCFQKGDADELRRCLIKLVADPALRREMGRRSRELVERELSWTSIAKRFLKIYEKALGLPARAEDLPWKTGKFGDGVKE